MTKKHVAILLAAGALLFSACQHQSELAGGDTDTVAGKLSDITHEPLGKAELHEQDGKLVATNMHSTEDGVRSLYQPSINWQAALNWKPSVSAIRLNSINSRLSGEDTTSRLALDRVGGDEWAVNASFVSPNYRVNVYRGTRLVGSLPPSTALRIRIRIDITINWHFRVIRITIGNGTQATAQQCVWGISTPAGVQVVQGNTVLGGDRVELVEDPHESYGGFDEIQVLGNGDVTYLAEEVVTE